MYQGVRGNPVRGHEKRVGQRAGRLDLEPHADRYIIPIPSPCLITFLFTTDTTFPVLHLTRSKRKRIISHVRNGREGRRVLYRKEDW